MSSARALPHQRVFTLQRSALNSSGWMCGLCQRARSTTSFSTSAPAKQDERQDKGPFRTGSGPSTRKSRYQWKPIPVGLGIGFLGAVQLYRVREREKRRIQEEADALNAQETHKDGGEHTGWPKKRKRIRPSGPW